MFCDCTIVAFLVIANAFRVIKRDLVDKRNEEAKILDVSKNDFLSTTLQTQIDDKNCSYAIVEQLQTALSV